MLKYLDRLLRNPDPNTTKRCIDAADWAARAPTLSEDKGRLSLEHAKGRYQDQRESVAALESKLGELLRFDGALTVGLFAVVRFANVAPSTWLLTSIGLLVASMVLCVYGRIATDKPVRAPISEILDCLSRVDDPASWLASSLHIAVEASKDTTDRAATRLNTASVLTCLAMVFLFLALLTFGALPVAPP